MLKMSPYLAERAEYYITALLNCLPTTNLAVELPSYNSQKIFYAISSPGRYASGGNHLNFHKNAVFGHYRS